MRTTRFATSIAFLGAMALPVISAPGAMAAPSSAPASAPATRPCDRLGPWVIGTKAMTIRSKATSRSAARGVLYRGLKFAVHKTHGNWHYITDKTTGVKGWVSGTYVYREVYMGLD
ncbi:SH3 domain-containing protein [Streptomyces sp. SAS_270]|uniref:SH3 domain-containing protein n=1 Tax=Streptomyces sp. SAS_270 TaxID=3412748 RepID=UPI00403CBC91